MAQVKGYLALETGRVFEGWLFGASPNDSQTGGEVVFNTSLCGYQEILTDPSYQGQIVVMTPSHVGNYGINPDDMESRRVYLSGFIVQEQSAVYSNWRASKGLDQYLSEAGVPGLSGVDTRALTRYLRSQGAVNGIILAAGTDAKKMVKRAKAVPSLGDHDLTQLVTTDSTYQWTEGSGSWKESMLVRDLGAPTNPKRRVVVMDFGVKQNILRCLVDQNCDVTVVPASATTEEILEHNPDGVLLSNGPGDPAAVKNGIKTIQGLIEENLSRKKKGGKPVPVFGICLGHQLMGLALGGTTYKLKFGHHGANHPIKDIETGRVDITTQNHGFAVKGEKLSNGEWVVKGNKDALVTHINLNDEAIEGLRHKTLPMFSVQYHPEAASGPHDARHLFDRFLNLINEKGN